MVIAKQAFLGINNTKEILEYLVSEILKGKRLNDNAFRHDFQI